MNPEIPSDREMIKAEYQRSLEPPTEANRHWQISVVHTKEYIYTFYGTYEQAQSEANAAKDYKVFQPCESVDETVTAEVLQGDMF